MKIILSIVALSLVFNFADAAMISKVKGKKAIARGDYDEFQKGDTVVIYDGDQKITVGKIKKITGKKYYLKLGSRRARQGMEVRQKKSARRSLSKGGILSGLSHSAIAVAGFYPSDFSGSVLSFGADYRATVDRFPKLAFRAGFTYGLGSSNTEELSITEFGVGAEYLIPMDKLTFGLGGRIGYALLTVKTKVSIFSASVDDSSFTIAPYANAFYSIGKKMSVGAEIRIPQYISSDGGFSGNMYILGAFQYHF